MLMCEVDGLFLPAEVEKCSGIGGGRSFGKNVCRGEYSES